MKKCVVSLPNSVLTVEYVIFLYNFALFDVLEKAAKQVTCRVALFFFTPKTRRIRKASASGMVLTSLLLSIRIVFISQATYCLAK